MRTHGLEALIRAAYEQAGRLTPADLAVIVADPVTRDERVWLQIRGGVRVNLGADRALRAVTEPDECPWGEVVAVWVGDPAWGVWLEEGAETEAGPSGERDFALAERAGWARDLRLRLESKYGPAGLD
jgi:hypothetical protein